MKKITIVAMIVFSFFTKSSFAQLQAGFQLGPQFPMGNMSDYNTGFGLIATAKYFVNDDAAFGLNVGFNRFGTGYDDINGSFIPITALFEYNLSGEMLVPYLGFDLGGYNYSFKYVIWGRTYSDSKFYFGFAPSAGLKYDFNDNIYFTGCLKWNYVMTDNDDADWLGLNIGVFYKL